MISSRQPITVLIVQVLFLISSCALPIHTPVPWDNPEICSKSANEDGFVSSSICRTNRVPISGTPKVATGRTDLLRRNAERFDGVEEAHDFRIVHRNRRRIDAGQILQHPHHRRIVVPENIELEQVRVEGMVIEMGRFPLRVFVVGRELNRRNVFDVDIIRNDDDPARMLAGASLDARTAGRQTG